MDSIPNPVADVAMRALGAFGGDMDRATAVALLPMWRYYRDLTEQDRAEVLARFPIDDRFAAEVEQAIRRRS